MRIEVHFPSEGGHGMVENLVIYRPKERLVIIAEHELDYEVEDLETGAHYIIDKIYFRRKYESDGTVNNNY